MMRPTILTPEWRKKKKELAEELLRRGKMFYQSEKWKKAKNER